MTELTCAAAVKLCEGVLAEGRRQGFQPLCAVVLDKGGHLLALQRDERASIGRPQIATGKAAGCLALGVGGRELKKRAAAMPGFFSGAASILPAGIVPVPGGVLIRDEGGAIIGAVGVSGDVSEADELCAVSAISALGLTADTGEQH